MAQHSMFMLTLLIVFIIVTQQSILNMHYIGRNINSLEPMKIVNVLYEHCILMECRDMHVSTTWHNIPCLCLHYEHHNSYSTKYPKHALYN
jgi:hypothetical protein